MPAIDRRDRDDVEVRAKGPLNRLCVQVREEHASSEFLHDRRTFSRYGCATRGDALER